MQPNPKLTIELLPNGSIRVEGPIDNKLLCYGMLEATKLQIEHHNREKAKIVPGTAEQGLALKGGL